MPTITYAYDIGTTVYAVDKTTGVQKAVVSQLSISQVFPTVAPTIEYVVQYVCPSSSATSTKVEESKLFADVDSAMNAYKLLVSC